MRANAESSRSFARPAKFDLQLEWTVGVGGGGGEERNRDLHSPTPTPLLIFDRRPPPWYKFIPFPSRPLPLKPKMAAIMFVMKLLSTCQWFPVFFQVLQSTVYVEVQILYWRTSCDLKPAGLPENARKFIPDAWLDPKINTWHGNFTGRQGSVRFEVFLL